MGWREASHKHIGVVATAGYVEPLLQLDPADRIALARELLAGTDAMRGGKISDIPSNIAPIYWQAFFVGWDACRAAMMGEEG